MKRFEPGKTYFCRSILDHNCIFEIEVIKRTKKFITIKDPHNSKEKIRRKVYTHFLWPDVELCDAYGSYSMSPTFMADAVSQ